MSDTSDLIRRGQDGDRRALADLLAQHRERLRRMVQLRLDPRLRARVDDSDVLQEICMEAWRRLPEHVAKPQAPFFVWLRSIARQKLIDLHRYHLQAQVRDPRREFRLDRLPRSNATSMLLAVQLLGQHAPPSELAIQAELELRLEVALNKLGAGDREVLLLRHFEDLSHAEIAHELGIGVSAAKKRYVRSLKRLKALLEGTDLAGD